MTHRILRRLSPLLLGGLVAVAAAALLSVWLVGCDEPNGGKAQSEDSAKVEYLEKIISFQAGQLEESSRISPAYLELYLESLENRGLEHVREYPLAIRGEIRSTEFEGLPLLMATFVGGLESLPISAEVAVANGANLDPLFEAPLERPTQAEWSMYSNMFVGYLNLGAARRADVQLVEDEGFKVYSWPEKYFETQMFIRFKCMDAKTTPWTPVKDRRAETSGPGVLPDQQIGE